MNTPARLKLAALAAALALPFSSTALADSGALGQCSVGHWVVDLEQMASAFSGMFGDMPGVGAPDVTIQGGMSVRLNADGSYRVHAENARFDIRTPSPMGEVSMDITHHGTDTGTWRVTGDQLHMETTTSGIDTRFGPMRMGGRTIPMPAPEQEGNPWSGTLEAQCSNQRLILTQHEAGQTFSTHLIRAN